MSTNILGRSRPRRPMDAIRVVYVSISLFALIWEGINKHFLLRTMIICPRILYYRQEET